MKIRKRSLLAVPAALIAAAAVWWWVRTSPNRHTIEEFSDGLE